MALGNPAYEYTYKHIVVVHGIGDQAPNETALNFMNYFLRALPQGAGHALEVDNLIESVDDIRSTAPAGAPNRSFHPAYLVFTSDPAQRNFVIGFSEVYWQHITNGYLARNNGAPPIPIFIWAHSINTRFLRRGRLFHVAREAIDNLEAMLRLLLKLAVIGKKSGTLVKVLNRFLGDVEMYTESDQIREEINDRFHSVLQRIPAFARQTMARFPGAAFTATSPEIYVVAHSEGTVVSYNSLVEAAQRGEGWFDYVKGLVTLGSPLDKHYTIWHNRFHLDCFTGAPREPKIRWHNYWDQSDPVGYGLKALFQEPDSDARKLFDVGYDQGFTRYPVPGLAHVAYWEDTAIHEDIINRVMEMGTTRADTTVQSRWWQVLQSAGDKLAYVLVRAVTLSAALFSLNKLLGPVRTDRFLWLMSGLPTASRRANFLVWIFVPLLAGEGLWWLYTRCEGALALVLQWLRRLVLLGWALAALAICLGVSLGDEAARRPQVKDWLGYLVGLVVSVLVWKLHTTVHRGLIQMWRYTKGKSTAWKA